MPFTQRHAFGDAAFVNHRVGGLPVPAGMPFAVTPGASRHDVLRRISATVLLGDQVLSGALQLCGRTSGKLVAPRKPRIAVLPHWKPTIKAQAVLRAKGIEAKFLKS